MSTLKPIRTNKDHADAMKEIDRLLASDLPKGADADRLEMLTILVEAFERSHPDHRIDDKFDPVAALEFHLDRTGKDPKDLETILECSRARVWEIMNRKRALTLQQIRALVRELGIPAERLLSEYTLSGKPQGSPKAARAAKPSTKWMTKEQVLKSEGTGGKRYHVRTFDRSSTAAGASTKTASRARSGTNRPR